MRQQEVVVAVRLEAGVVAGVVAVAGFAENGVEVPGVVVEEVCGGEVGLAAEPPGDRLVAILALELEVAVVGVRRRDQWAARVDDDAHARRPEPQSAELQPAVPAARQLGHLRLQPAAHDPHVHAGTVEHRPAAQHAAVPAAAFGALPHVAGETAPRP